MKPASVLLALETSTDACSVALAAGERLALRERREARAHATVIMPMIDELLVELGLSFTDIDGIAYGHGPGSFTGVRIAVALAQGLAFGSGIPVAGISSLRLLAQQALDARPGAQTVCVAQDARMGEVYAGRYRRNEAGIAMTSTGDALRAPADVLPLDDGLAVGNGFTAFALLAEALAAAGVTEYCESAGWPSARTLLRIATAVDADLWTPAEQAQAVYLRNDVAQVAAPR